MTLIKHRIQTLVLREFAPFPSQVSSAKEMVKEWQYDKRKLRLVRSERDSDRWGADYPGADTLVGGEEP